MQLVDLALVVPDLTVEILDGQQPAALNSEPLIKRARPTGSLNVSSSTHCADHRQPDVQTCYRNKTEQRLSPLLRPKHAPGDLK